MRGARVCAQVMTARQKAQPIDEQRSQGGERGQFVACSERCGKETRQCVDTADRHVATGV